MDERTLDRSELLGGLPPARAEGAQERIQSLIEKIDRKVIVLDDDPTGTQTVHQIPVVTRFSVDHLIRELEDRAPASYVLTNSRSLDEAEAIALSREIARNLRDASRETGRDYTVISRSDSTLRGHFPAELDVLESELEHHFDAWVLCPFFGEGGRVTVGDVHYVSEGDCFVPAAKTPFARDAAFGYHTSNLRGWVAEKSQGRISPDRMTSLSIEELRSEKIGSLERKVASLRPGSVCIINAADERDLQQALRAFLSAEAAGKRYLYRTGASFVAARAGVKPRSLLAAHELPMRRGRGMLFVVGSHVPKTTRQLEELLEIHHPAAVELRVEELLDDRALRGIIAATVETAERTLAADDTMVVFTSRQIVGSNRAESLAIAKKVSHALVELVRTISTTPRALVAKGGITSSDLATRACGVQRALVLGQILPGVPVWECGPESRYPGMPLVVFPGNVGDSLALAAVLDRLRQATSNPSSSIS
jgi:uncharacterized protein YgbK (DUF1537 family)